MPKKPTSPSIDQILDHLDQLVQLLEKGELSLEDSMKTFEEGCAMIRQCQTVLNETEKKIQILDEQTKELRLPLDQEIDA